MQDESSERPTFLLRGESARLIPIGAGSARENRASSVLLATLMTVDEFGKQLLAPLGGPATARSRVACLVDIALKSDIKAGHASPDGLIIESNGRRTWRALIEAKIGANPLSSEQIVTYLDLARHHGIDAVITISNQFATFPTHHPVSVNRNKLRSVSLFHWTWLGLLSEASLLVDNGGVRDSAKAYVLREFIRYLAHASSGVMPFNRMPGGWRSLCDNARNGAAIGRQSAATHEVISGWHQLVGSLTHDLAGACGRGTSVRLSRAHRRDPAKRSRDAMRLLAERFRLEDAIHIPGAVAPLNLAADVRRRTLSASMRVRPPGDLQRATACATWIRNRLEKCDDDAVLITARYAGRRADRQATLAEARQDRRALTHDDLSNLPIGFDVKKVTRRGNRFCGSKTFVEEARNLALFFCRDVAPHLVPPRTRRPTFNRRPD